MNEFRRQILLLPARVCRQSSFQTGKGFTGSSVLLTSNIVKFLTKFSDQRERPNCVRAAARIGWRLYRPVVDVFNSEIATMTKERAQPRIGKNPTRIYPLSPTRRVNEYGK